jgi:hypothetical protein
MCAFAAWKLDSQGLIQKPLNELVAKRAYAHTRFGQMLIQANQPIQSLEHFDTAEKVCQTLSLIPSRLFYLKARRSCDLTVIRKPSHI